MAGLQKSCISVARFGGRESIFLISHTNEFCGKSKVARELTVACKRVNVGRCISEEYPGSWEGVPRALQGM
jgi:hypothetical protein